jgi:predicted dinucleotide-binding enzyme
MKIGIIGAGQIGGSLARRLTALGHEVAVANSRGPETLAGLEAETGAHAATVADAVRGAELVVVTIPEARIRDLPAGLFAGVPDDVVVVDTGNYYPRERDGRIEEIEAGMTESRWVERRLGRPVVKAFNNIAARHLMTRGRPRGSPDRLALPVAGDRDADKAVVLRLIDELGFDGIDAGGLDDSWRQQPGTPVYVVELGADEVRRALAEASPERRPAFRATENSPGSFAVPA